MALSLSPNQFKQVIHTSSLSNTPLQSYSTPRQFSTIVNDNNKIDHQDEVSSGMLSHNFDHSYKTLSMGQTEPPLPSSGFGHVTHNDNTNKLASPSRSQAALPDLPSWTPLRAPGDNEGSSASDPEIDELATWKTTKSPTKRHSLAKPPTSTRRPVVQITVPARRTSSSSSITKSSTGKRARFDGVLITTKPPRYSKPASVQRVPPPPASNALTFSLVDALSRTFDANKYTEDHFGRPRRDDVSSGLHTDVETTEAEDEQLQLNARRAHGPSKRQRTLATTRRALAGHGGLSTNASETTSEDSASLQVPVGHRQDRTRSDRDGPQHHPTRSGELRSVKRLKPIQYEANPALIDAALGTVQAPISWDAEMDIIARDDDDFMTPVQTAAHTVSQVDVQMSQAGGHPTNASSSDISSSVPNTAMNEWHTPMWTGPKRGTFLPYQSRRDKFRQRLNAIFGENATVRTDRVARPRPVDLEFFTSLDEPEREPSPSASESTVSASSVSRVERVASAVPSTHITSQSPDILLADVNMERVSGKQVDEGGSSAAKKPMLGVNEEQIGAWVVALQRLIKGKIRVQEGHLDTLSIILAEVESVKDNLDQSLPMTSELRESVRQLAVLHEIPFGDRNKLRQRAGRILRSWPSTGKPGAS